jgi:hypothetical protein
MAGSESPLGRRQRRVDINARELLKTAFAAYHEKTQTMKRLALICTATVALLAAMVGHVHLPQAAALNLVRFRQIHSVAKQLPAGFVLPSSDVDLKISSFVAADLDADGDLDIVASDAANGSVHILVWVNDGAGRLTRKHPEPPKSLGTVPPGPSVNEQYTTVVALLQPDSPAVQSASSWWATLPERSAPHAIDTTAVSTTVSTRRSRSPPALS